MDRKYLQVEGHDDLVRDTKSTAIINKNKGGFAPITVEEQREQIEMQRQEVEKQKEQILEMIDG